LTFEGIYDIIYIEKKRKDDIMKEIKVALIQLNDVRDIKDTLRGILFALKNDDTIDRDWLVH